jgi:ArsR family transcriptional regulator
MASTRRPRLPTPLFKALGDPRRVAILGELLQACEPRTVGEISSCCPTDLSVVSRHLSVLRAAGVVEAEKRGRQVFYRARSSELADALRGLAEAIEACCPPPRRARSGRRR